jgi:hypothetical protein
MEYQAVMAAVAKWEPVVELIVTLGVSTFDAIKALMTSAGVDADVIAAMELKYAVLYADVRRAAGLPPETPPVQ